MYYFELFDFKTINQLATFDTEREALEEVAGLADVNLPELLAMLTLSVVGDNGTLELASGPALVERARAFVRASVAAG